MDTAILLSRTFASYLLMCLSGRNAQKRQSCCLKSCSVKSRSPVTACMRHSGQHFAHNQSERKEGVLAHIGNLCSRSSLVLSKCMFLPVCARGVLSSELAWKELGRAKLDESLKFSNRGLHVQDYVCNVNPRERAMAPFWYCGGAVWSLSLLFLTAAIKRVGINLMHGKLQTKMQRHGN